MQQLKLALDSHKESASLLGMADFHLIILIKNISHPKLQVETFMKCGNHFQIRHPEVPHLDLVVVGIGVISFTVIFSTGKQCHPLVEHILVTQVKFMSGYAVQILACNPRGLC